MGGLFRQAALFHILLIWANYGLTQMWNSWRLEMLHILKIAMIVMLMSGLGIGGAQAQGADIKSTIDRQIEAFQADDFETAFGFASPNLQRLFGNPDNFRRMVTRGYPMVWRPAEVRYLELADVNGSLWQKVLIKDQKGVVHVLGYRMLETDMGWKINGVQLFPSPGADA
jgi:hypothetical protein|tara:strand:- start:430 stop:939 length:510 start_codon:yes stop_codon:yes gene_type:complete